MRVFSYNVRVSPFVSIRRYLSTSPILFDARVITIRCDGFKQVERLQSASMRSGGNFRFISNFVRKLNAQCVRMNNASYSWGCDKLLRYRNARFSSCSICSCAKIVAFTVYYKELYDTTPTMIYYRRGRRGIVINNENRTFVEFWVWEIRERYNGGGGRGEWGEEEKRQSTTAWSIIMWSSRVKNTYYSTYFTREEIIVTLVSHRLYIYI